MKLIPILLGVIAIISALLLHFRKGRPRPAAYRGVREQILRSRRPDHIPAPPTQSTPWAVVMDWKTAKGVTTVVALADGHTRVYLSNGTGHRGGDPEIAKRVVALAADRQPLMQRTNSYPLPRRGEMIFYLLTDSGVFAAAATEQKLKAMNDPLANTMQELAGRTSTPPGTSVSPR